LERLRYIREQVGYSQQDLADKSGVSQHTISEIELGRRKPQGRTLRKLARSLGVEVADLLGGPELPLGEAPPSPEQPSFNGLLEEERRLHYLKPWAGYVSTLANNVEREIEQGHITDLNWWREFNRDVLTLIHLYNQVLPTPAEQTEDERLELLRFSEAIDRLSDVAEKMDRAMEPVITEMHKEMYARERERRKAALKIIHGRISA
jgi:transcriptional regulator with XRE-family HTH domain